MKTKRPVIVLLTAALGGGILWLATAQPSGASARGERQRVNTTGQAQEAPRSDAARATIFYTCPMHPSVRLDKPGGCSICGMALQPVYGNTGGTNPPPAPAGINRPATEMPGCCSPGSCR